MLWHFSHLSEKYAARNQSISLRRSLRQWTATTWAARDGIIRISVSPRSKLTHSWSRCVPTARILIRSELVRILMVLTAWLVFSTKQKTRKPQCWKRQHETLHRQCALWVRKTTSWPTNERAVTARQTPAAPPQWSSVTWRWNPRQRQTGISGSPPPVALSFTTLAGRRVDECEEQR